MAARRRSGRPARRRWSDIEREMRKQGGPLIAGVDEVGRGPLAGPVVACAVVMPPDQRAIRGVDDSKALTAAERERLSDLIRQRALAIGEKLGVFRDYPVSKGCTSPFAPIWINFMVSRQG